MLRNKWLVNYYSFLNCVNNKRPEYDWLVRAWFNDFYSDMFSLDFDCLFQPLLSFLNFVIANLLVIGFRVLQFRGNHASNFKSALRYMIG